MAISDRLPEAGEWWTHLGFGAMYWFSGRKGPSFRIEEVIVKDPMTESWVIYSNDDNSGDYFVVGMWEFIQGEWEIDNGDSD